jgi:hypothetical protein
MTRLTIWDKGQLPTEPRKLNEFIIIGKEKLNAQLAKIRAIEKINMAQNAKDGALIINFFGFLFVMIAIMQGFECIKKQEN